MKVRQRVNAARGVGALRPGVGPGGEDEAARRPRVQHELVDGSAHPLAPAGIAALVETVEQHEGAAPSGNALEIRHRLRCESVSGLLEVSADEGPQVAGTRRRAAGRQLLGEAAKHDADRQQRAVRPVLSQLAQLVGVSLPRLRQRQQDAGAEGAFAAAGFAEERQLAVCSERFEGGNRAGRIQRISTVLVGSRPERQPFAERLVHPDAQRRVERHVDVCQLQRVVLRLLGRCMNLGEPEPGQVFDERMEVQRDDGLPFLSIVARLGDLHQVRDVVAADEMSVGDADRVADDGAAVAVDVEGGGGRGLPRLALHGRVDLCL